MALWSAIATVGGAFSKVIHEGDSTYIVDRHGERWDVTQANAYSVPRLWRHEVANSSLGDKKIAAAY